MPAFAYIGDREETQVFGLRFPRGVPVEVTDPHTIFKLTNNRDFARDYGGVQVLEPVVSVSVTPMVERAPEPPTGIDTPRAPDPAPRPRGRPRKS